MLGGGTICLLFTDFRGSTSLMHALGDHEANKVLRSYFSLLRTALHERGGREVKSMGDGLMVAFESVKDALNCAVDMQNTIRRRNLMLENSTRLQLRIGLHVGEPIREGDDYFGSSVVVAYRLCDLARGGQILASEAVHGIAAPDGFFKFEDLGVSDIKDFPDQWRIYELKWEQEEAPGAFALATIAERTPFVGRAAELAKLRQLVDQTSHGQGGLVLIGGEAGVGKSRIAQELQTEARDVGLFSHVGHCHEIGGKAPYAPFIEILESATRIANPQTIAEIFGDAAPEIARLMPELRSILPDIPAPSELPPDQRRRYLFNCMREALARAAQARPQIIVLEDLQWADESSLLLLHHIAESLNEMSVTIIGNYRDIELEYGHSLTRIMEDLLRNRLAHCITLRRLPKHEVSAMMKARSGQEPPNRLLNRIYEQTEGNPFFVEEMFKQLAEDGKLFEESGGAISTPMNEISRKASAC